MKKVTNIEGELRYLQRQELERAVISKKPPHRIKELEDDLKMLKDQKGKLKNG